MLETFVNFVAENPIAFVLVAGVAIIVLGLVGKFTLPRIGEIGIEPDSRRLAVGVGLLLVAVGAGLLYVQTQPPEGNGPEDGTVVAAVTAEITATAPEPPIVKPPVTATEDPRDRVEQTVSRYFDFLNEQAYKEAWELLSPEFQSGQVNGISGYETYWRTVPEVEIVEFEPAFVSSNGNEGEVVVSLIYHLDDSSPDVYLRFCLILNTTWLIDRAVGTDSQC